MNEKKMYERATVSVLTLSVKDIITTSTYEGDVSSGIILPEDIF